MNPPASLWEWMQRRHPRFKYDVGHQTIASLLEAAACGGVKRLLITVPPCIGLSNLVSLDFPAYYLGHHPDNRVLEGHYCFDAALRFSRQLRSEILSPEYRAAFGHRLAARDGRPVVPNGDHTVPTDGVPIGCGDSVVQADHWDLYDQHGGVKVVGVGGALTGWGSDLVILDSLVKDREDARSKVRRAALVEWYRSTVSTRLRDNNGAIVVAMPRFHRRDFAGWIQKVAAKEEPWVMVNLPALDSRGESLWPNRFSTGRYHQIRAQIGEADFAALYMGEPRKKGE